MKLIKNSQLLLLFVVILTLSTDGSAQQSRNVQTDAATLRIPSCDTLITARIDRVAKIESRTPQRLYPPFDQKLISPALSDLLKDVGDNELRAYRLKEPRQTALIMITTRVGRPWSEGSIQDWFIQVGANAVRFKSVATNPNLIFWDDGGRLTLITLLYSKNGIVVDALPDLVSLDLRRHRLNDSGSPELIEEEKNVRCVLTIAKPL